MINTHKFLYLLCALLCIQNIYSHSRIFVSPKGSDKNKGSIASPFKTIEKALSEVKTIDEDSVEICLREGVYNLAKTVEIKNLRHINIHPYNNESVSITGGVSISRRYIKKVTDPEVLNRAQSTVAPFLFEIDLQKMGQKIEGLSAKGFGRASLPSWNELFIDGEPLQIARWPNDSTVLIGKIHCTGDIPRNKETGIGDPKFEYLEDRPSQWNPQGEAWIAGYFSHGYADDMIPLKELDPQQKTITAGMSTMYGFMTGAKFRRWYALNLLEELDLPNEYVLDTKKQKIYFLKKQKKSQSIHVSFLKDPLFAIEQSENITLQGFTMEYSRGMAVYIEESVHCKVQDCTIRNLGYIAACIGRGDLPVENITEANHEGSTHYKEGVKRIIGTLNSRWYIDRIFNRHAGHFNGIENCHIYNVGAGGISLGGGDRATLEQGHNYVDNCKIHDFNRIEKSYKAGVIIDGVGNSISHCEIFNAPSMGILLNGNDHLISYCDIHHVCQEVDDQGAIYYGRDASERGNKVRYCYLHDMVSKHNIAGVYHDDGACGMEVFGCLFYKAGTMPVLIGGGHDNIYKNNVFIDLPMAFHIDNRMEGWGKAMLDKKGIMDQRLQTIHYKQAPYSTRYPKLVHYWENHPRHPRGNCINGNLFYKVKELTDVSLSFADWSNNWIAPVNPGFVDIENPLKGFIENAPVYNKILGFSPIPFDKIGLKNNNK